jgi:organic radical activating enzyme
MLAEVASTGLENVVVTGGEPLEHPGFVLVVDALKAAGRRIEVETAGTQFPRSSAVDQWNVSLKLAHSGVAAEVRLRADAIAAFRDRDAWFKFVAATERDVDEVLEIQTAHRLASSRILLMPLGMRREEQQARCQQSSSGAAATASGSRRGCTSWSGGPSAASRMSGNAATRRRGCAGVPPSKRVPSRPWRRSCRN